jgi:hypothetical protein
MQLDFFLTKIEFLYFPSKNTRNTFCMRKNAQSGHVYMEKYLKGCDFYGFSVEHFICKLEMSTLFRNESSQ